MDVTCKGMQSFLGSGHEPMHAGFVGMGNARCRLSGDFHFSYPDQMLEAAKG